MKDKRESQQYRAAVIFLLYFLPCLLVSSYSLSWLPLQGSWSLFSLGLLLASSGTAALYFVLSETKNPVTVEREEVPPFEEAPPPQEILEAVQLEAEEAKEHAAELTSKLQEAKAKIEEVAGERDRERKKHERVSEEFSHYKEKSQAMMEEERIIIEEHEEAVAGMRLALEQKQLECETLQNKIHDLTYEIKTLLHLADIDSSIGGQAVKESVQEYQVDLVEPKPVTKTPVIAYSLPAGEGTGSQLKRCINIAQKITSSHNFGSYSSRFRDLSLDNDALDLRRLCDNLSSENGNTVFVYSQKERRLLFVNGEIEDLLGWSPEKFIRDFEYIVQEGMEEWRAAVTQLNAMKQMHTHFIMKKKSGHDMLVQCELGLIPTGVFRNNVIGILFSGARSSTASTL